jgi:hypothetical protein
MTLTLVFLLSSGYDFGYLIRLLTNESLPDEETDFFQLILLYFPQIYDVKYLMKSCKNLKGGLQEVADILKVNWSIGNVVFSEISFSLKELVYSIKQEVIASLRDHLFLKLKRSSLMTL